MRVWFTQQAERQYLDALRYIASKNPAGTLAVMRHAADAQTRSRLIPDRQGGMVYCSSAGTVDFNDRRASGATGAHRLCKPGVEGSNPFSSTIKSRDPGVAPGSRHIL